MTTTAARLISADQRRRDTPDATLARIGTEELFVRWHRHEDRRARDELVQRFLEDVPMKRFGEPEEIGELVLFMCSDACSFMTADTVYVNGGGGWR